MADEKLTPETLRGYWLGESGPLKAFDTEGVAPTDETVVGVVVDSKKKKELFKATTIWMLQAYSTKTNAKRLWPDDWTKMTVKQLSETLIPTK